MCIGKKINNRLEGLEDTASLCQLCVYYMLDENIAT